MMAKQAHSKARPRARATGKRELSRWILTLEFRLPNGTVTRNSMKYVDAWRAFARPLERALGGSLESFDPDISFVIDSGRRSIQVPLEVVEAFNRRDAGKS